MDPSKLPKMSETVNKLKGQRSRIAALAGGALVLGGLFLGGSHCIYNVEGGHRAIIFNRFTGIRKTVYAEGTHFKLPWFDRPIIYNIRVKAHNIPTRTGSKDLQMVDITLRVLAKPFIDELPTIYRELGTDFDERVLPSIANEVLKSVVAQYNAAQLMSMRAQVSLTIRERLIDRAKDFNILLDDVAITHLSFGHEYMAAVEAKQVAQQEAERARFIVERAKQTKLEIIVKAEGEAIAAKAFNEQLRDDPNGNFLALRKIEAAKDIARTLASGHNRIYLSANNLLLNLTKAIECERPEISRGGSREYSRVERVSQENEE